MDQYIKMCREAEEIQGLWEPKEADKYIYNEHEWYMPPNACFGEANNSIWLPRIEDLINISSDGIFGCDNDDHWLDEFYGYNEVFPNANDSIIIRILKFTMLNLYNKSWDGEKWIT